MSEKRIKSALISVYSKDGLDPIIRQLHALGVQFCPVPVERNPISKNGYSGHGRRIAYRLSEYSGRPGEDTPSRCFQRMLARREPGHLAQFAEYNIPEIDCVIVDLYPFEETVASTHDESEIIKKDRYRRCFADPRRSQKLG